MENVAASNDDPERAAAMALNIDALIEAQIRAARERGAFDDLPGRGKPLELEDLSHLSPEQRMEALLLRTCGELSPEGALLRQISELRRQLETCESPERRDSILADMRAKALEVAKTWRRR